MHRSPGAPAAVIGARSDGLERATVELARAVTASDVARSFLEVTEGVVCAAAAAVYLLDDRSGELVLAASSGIPQAAIARSRVIPPADERPLTRAVATGAPVWVESYQELVRAFPRLATTETPAAVLQ